MPSLAILFSTIPGQSSQLPSARAGLTCLVSAGRTAGTNLALNRQKRKGRIDVKNTERAIWILIVLASVLMLAGAWDLPEDART